MNQADEKKMPREFYARTENVQIDHGTTILWVVYEGKQREGFIKTPVAYIRDKDLAREICYPSYAQRLEEQNATLTARVKQLEIDISEGSGYCEELDLKNTRLTAENFKYRQEMDKITKGIPSEWAYAILKKERDELREKCERYRKALGLIVNFSVDKSATQTASDALEGK